MSFAAMTGSVLEKANSKFYFFVSQEGVFNRSQKEIIATSLIQCHYDHVFQPGITELHSV